MNKKKKSLKLFFLGLPKRILIFLCGTENKHINRTAFWTMILTLFTSVLFVVGFYEINDYRRNRDAEFLFKITSDFFTPETKEFTYLFENNLIKFNDPNNDTAYGFPNKFGLFIINKEHKGVNKILLDSNRILYTAYDIDHYLLNKLDCIGQYERNGLIDIKDVYSSFSFYIFTIWDNKSIKEYIDYLSDHYKGNTFFKDVQGIYDKLLEWERTHKNDNN